MKTTKIPIDGLLRCLCPSIDSLAVLRPISGKKVPAKYSAFRLKGNDLPNHSKPRFYSSSAAPPRKIPSSLLSKHYSELESADSQQQLSQSTPDTGSWDTLSVDQLHDLLRRFKLQEDGYKQVCDLVEYLVKVRGDKPALVHYDALIAVNADAENGSALYMKILLAEMKEFGISGDAALYHSALQVLAIHPDYVLRTQILEEMKERWYGLSPSGWHNLIVGLLRDRQFEMALDKFEQMQADEVEVKPWLYDIFFYRLCEFGELDEALRLLRTRYKSPGLALPMYYYLLDSFSSALHYEGTHYVWKLRVKDLKLNPSDGICTAVLNCAARYGDPMLASDSIKFLSQRNTYLGQHHYEALLEAYVRAQDIRTAFRILNIMYKAGINPDVSATRPLYHYLSKSPNLVSDGWETLEDLHAQGHNITTAAVNVVLEASTSVSPVEGTERALDYYKQMHTICKAGPNIETFNHLLRGLAKIPRGKKMAMFLASEINALGLKPDALTYDRLVLICLSKEYNDYEDAFRYLDEMKMVGKDTIDSSGTKGWWLRKGTIISLGKRCVLAGDERGWALLTEMEERGLVHEHARFKSWAEQNWPKPRDGVGLIQKIAAEKDFIWEDMTRKQVSRDDGDVARKDLSRRDAIHGDKIPGVVLPKTTVLDHVIGKKVGEKPRDTVRENIVQGNVARASKSIGSTSREHGFQKHAVQKETAQENVSQKTVAHKKWDAKAPDLRVQALKPSTASTPAWENPVVNTPSGTTMPAWGSLVFKNATTDDSGWKSTLPKNSDAGTPTWGKQLPKEFIR